MLKKLLFLLCMFVWLAPAPVLAQTSPALSKVDVDLWPEFDRPTMLVIYHMTLPPGGSLPVEMRVPIPATAGAPNAVAALQPDGSLITIPYTQEMTGEWSEVVFQATTPEVQVEYYDPGLTKNGQQRSFVYSWPGGFAVEAFSVQVQEPTGASGMTIKPGTVTTSQGRDGLTYYTLDAGKLAEGQTFDITIEYTRETDELTASSMPVESSAPLDETTAGRASMTAALPVVLGLLGVLLIVGGGLWYWRSGRQTGSGGGSRRPRRKPAGRSTAQEAQAEQGGHVYCHQCGKRAAPGDRFCRTCGTQLRLG